MKIPFTGKNKKNATGENEQLVKKSKGNGHSWTEMPFEDFKTQMTEMITQVTDQRMDERESAMPAQRGIDSANLRDLLFNTPASHYRELCIRTHRETALDPQIYGLSYLATPGKFFTEGWGKAIVRDDKGKLNFYSLAEVQALNPKGTHIGYTRESGDLLSFVMLQKERISRSGVGYMLNRAMKLTEQDTEIKNEERHLPPGA